MELDEKQIELGYGYIDDSGELHRNTIIREMSGVEEDILLSDKQTEKNKFTSILENTIKQIGSIRDKNEIEKAVSELTIGDQSLLVLELRMLSVGEHFEFDGNCPQCGEAVPAEIDLNKLERYEPEDPEEREYILESPKGNTYKMKIPAIDDMELLNRKRKKKNESLMSDQLSVRVKEINGEEVIQTTQLRKLPYKDRVFLRNKFNEKEAGIEDEIEVPECQSCGNLNFTLTLDPTDREFFFPSEIRNDSNKTS